MRKILVIGANGMLGYAVVKYFERHDFQVITLTRSQYDIGKDPFEKFLPYLDGIDFVINCAGTIKPRITVNTMESTLRINAIFPRNLAKICKQRSIPCFHITTDCVFSGRKGKYDEKDFFDAEDLYGMSKNAGETSDCMVLRTSIIGEEKNQSRSLLEWARSQKGKNVNGFTNHLWNGVTTVHLAEVIYSIIRDKCYQEGTFHIHSPDVATKDKLLETFDKVYDLNLKITPVEADMSCDRSMRSIHNLSSKLCTKPIFEQVQEMREFFEA